MAQKTQPLDDDVEAFVAALPDARRREEVRVAVRLLQEATGEPPVVWSGGTVGFGRYAYRYESGRAGEWYVVGVAPRKAQLTFYFMDGFDAHGELLARLGPHTVARSCLYVKRLDAVDTDVLRELARRSFAATRAAHPD